MIVVNNVALSFGAKKLFDDVNIKFTPGNCYGLIGANGAGKSTFIKLLAGDLEAQSGQIIMDQGERLSVLRQDQFAFDEYTVMQTVLMGNQELYQVMKQKDELYAKEDFSDADGELAGKLEERFAEMNGWEAESEAATLLAGIGVGSDLLDSVMGELPADIKFKVLLVQALFGKPDNLLLDEPTNNLDMQAIRWLEDFLLDFPNTVIVVSHDRYFLNKVCTHIADIDFGKITAYAGNYDFWRRASELAIQLRSNQRKKNEDKAKELKTFIQRFSANASKAKQATARQKQLEKLQLDDMPISSRKYPYVQFDQEREAGKDVLRVEGISKTIDGEKVLDDVSFSVNKGDKVVFLANNDLATTTLFEILSGKMQPDAGEFNWGVTITKSYFPADNSEFFSAGVHNLVDWLRQYSKDQTETFVRGFLGKMLFSGEMALKKTNVLSGGEKVRCMLAKMMLSGANALMMDGPTNHLDLESITALNEGLIRYQGTLMFTSHDHEFVQTIATRVIEIDGGIKGDKLTTFDEYLGLA